MVASQETRIIGIINRVVIRQRLSDGYWDLTAIVASAHNSKKMKDYNRLCRRSQDFKAYYALVKSEVDISTSELIQTVKGGDVSLQGTWGHELIASHVAAWASPEVNYHIHKLIHERAREIARKTGQSFADVLFSTIFFEGEKGKRPWKPFQFQEAFHKELLKLNYAAKHGLKKTDIPLKVRVHNGGPIPTIYKKGWENALTLDGYSEAKQRKIRKKAKAVACILNTGPADLALMTMYNCAQLAETMEEYWDRLYALAGDGKLFVEEDTDTEHPKSYRPREDGDAQLKLWDTQRGFAAS